jgi:hypothetical protein
LVNSLNPLQFTLFSQFALQRLHFLFRWRLINKKTGDRQLLFCTLGTNELQVASAFNLSAQNRIAFLCFYILWWFINSILSRKTTPATRKLRGDTSKLKFTCHYPVYPILSLNLICYLPTRPCTVIWCLFNMIFAETLSSVANTLFWGCRFFCGNKCR